MPTLLLELGCEELPASACSEAAGAAARARPEPARRGGIACLRDAAADRVRRRRAAGDAAEQLVKGPPAERRDQAAAASRSATGSRSRPRGAGRPSVGPRAWGAAARRAAARQDARDRPRARVRQVDALGRERPPVRASGAVVLREARRRDAWPALGTSFGHRFTHGEVDIESAQEYAEHAAWRRRRARCG